MELLNKLLATSRDLDRSITLSAALGLVFTVLGVLFYMLARLVLAFQPASLPVAFDYGYLQPAAMNALIFGGFLALFLALCLRILRDAAGKAETDLSVLALPAVALHGLGVLFGLIGIFAGWNTGREYGEMVWPADTLIGLALILQLVVVGHGLQAQSKTSAAGTMAIGGLSGTFLLWSLGNLALPYGWVEAVSPFTGMQDQTLQEIFRLGVLLYFVVIPVLCGAYYALSRFYGLAIYSEAMIRFGLLATAVVLPLAAGGLLLNTAAPGLLQNLGVGALIALSAAILSLAYGVHYSFGRGSTKVRSNQIGMALRWSVALLTIFAVLRIVFAFPSMQLRFGYTAIDLRNVTLDAAVYGLLGMGAIALFLLEQSVGRHVSKTARGGFMIAGAIGAVLIISVALAQGITQSERLPATEAGSLVHKEWIVANAMDSFIEPPKTTPLMAADQAAPPPAPFVLRALFSYPGFEFVGALALFIAVLFAALGIVIARFSGPVYQPYSFNTGVPRVKPGADAAHGAH